MTIKKKHLWKISMMLGENNGLQEFMHEVSIVTLLKEANKLLLIHKMTNISLTNENIDFIS